MPINIHTQNYRKTIRTVFKTSKATRAPSYWKPSSVARLLTMQAEAMSSWVWAPSYSASRPEEDVPLSELLKSHITFFILRANGGLWLINKHWLNGSENSLSRKIKTNSVCVGGGFNIGSVLYQMGTKYFPRIQKPLKSLFNPHRVEMVHPTPAGPVPKPEDTRMLKLTRLYQTFIVCSCFR